MISFDWRLVKKVSNKPFILAWVFIFLCYALPEWWTGSFWWFDGWNFWAVFVAKVFTIFFVAQKLLVATNTFKQTKVSLVVVCGGILQGVIFGFGAGLIQFVLQMKSWTVLIILTNAVNLGLAGLVAVYFWFYLVWWQTQKESTPPDDVKKINS